MKALALCAAPLLLAALQPAASRSYWRTEIAFDIDDKLGGCAIGDLDPELPGNEIAVVSGSGQVYLVWRDGAGWDSAAIGTPAGEMIQCAIGDADPHRPGLELVVVGTAKGGEESGAEGVASILYKEEGGGWKTERIFEDSALLHGVAIGDGEVFVAGYSGLAHRVAREAEGWKAHSIAQLPGAGKSVALYEGNVYVAVTDGSLIRIERLGLEWSAHAVDERPAGRSRLGVSPLGIITSDDDGVLSLVGKGGRVELYADTDKLRGAVHADLDPSTPGLEAATAGYTNRVTILYRREGGYDAHVVLVDTEKFHHLAAGVLAGGPGIDLAACGYAGRLYVLHCVQP